jgi:hypothetical protein
MRDHELSVHGLASYLAFADRTYGRFVYGSLERYRRRKSRLEIAEVRRGSVLLVLKEAAESVSSAHGLAFTALVLKFLPDVIKAPAAAYRDFEEARFRRAERKRLAQRAEASSALQHVDSGDLRQILSAMLDAYATEYSRISGAQDFAVRAVEAVQISTAGQTAKSVKAQRLSGREPAGQSTRTVSQRRRKKRK